MYTIKQLKKMSTERLHKVFEAIKGYTLFNPYEERQFMILSIPCVEDVVAQSKTTTVKETVTLEVGWNKEIDKIGFMLSTNNVMVNRIFEAIHNAETKALYIPQRTEAKGRKSRFSYRDVWDMIYADIQGVRLSEIAKYFETSSVVVLQILTGKSYQWASGITENSFVNLDNVVFE